MGIVTLETDTFVGSDHALAICDSKSSLNVLCPFVLVLTFHHNSHTALTLKQHGHYYGEKAGTTYIAPIKNLALSANDLYEFTFHLVLGDIAAIRSYAYLVAGHSP